ncbi:MAG: hypothetical protein EXS05_05675 [Planctomycetaceae bacterium]|nr:hypothetical protein [Planctomycetaceae bacterium]
MRKRARRLVVAVVVATGGLALGSGAWADAVNRAPQSITPRTSERTTKTAAGAAASHDPGRSAGRWTTTGGALLIVLILIVASAKLFQRRGLTSRNTLPAEVLEVFGRSVIDERNAIHLVRCGSRLLVLGSSPAGLRTLTEITDPVEVESLADLCRSREIVTVAESVSRLFQRRPMDGKTGDAGERDLDPAVIRLRERMQPSSREAVTMAELPPSRGTAS